MTLAPRRGGLPKFAEAYEGFRVHDMHHRRVGEVGDLFIGSEGRIEYVGVKIGSNGSRRALMPAGAVRTDAERRLFHASEDKEDIRSGPAYNHPRDVTPAFERKCLAYYEVGAESLDVDIREAPTNDEALMEKRNNDGRGGDRIRIHRLHKQGGTR